MPHLSCIMLLAFCFCPWCEQQGTVLFNNTSMLNRRLWDPDAIKMVRNPTSLSMLLPSKTEIKYFSHVVFLDSNCVILARKELKNISNQIVLLIFLLICFNRTIWSVFCGGNASFTLQNITHCKVSFPLSPNKLIRHFSSAECVSQWTPQVVHGTGSVTSTASRVMYQPKLSTEIRHNPFQ